MSKVQKLIVEVVDAHNLAPKDGHGTSSPYVVVDFYGQRRKTRTAVRDLNPVWNEMLSFNVGAHNDIFGDVLELDVYHDQKFGPTRRENSLGRIRLSSTQFVRKGEEALIYYELKKKSLFNMIQGKVGLKIYYVDEEVPPPPSPEKPATPPPPKPEESTLGKEAVEQETKTKPEAEPENVEEPPAPPCEAPPENDKVKEEQPEKEKTEPEKPTEPEPIPDLEPQNPEEGVDPVEEMPPKASVMAAATISRSNSEIRFSGINGPQPLETELIRVQEMG